MSDDALIDTVTTGRDGRACVPLEAGSYYLVETDCPQEFQLDPAPIYFTVEDGETTRQTVTNAPFSGVLIHKTDSTTDQLLHSKAIVKRVIATGGQTVDIDYTTGSVYVDGELLDEPYLREEMTVPFDPMMQESHWEVPEHSIFVMGDNRNRSTDSRHQLVGPIDEDYVLGKVVFVLWPLDRFGSI